MNVLKTLLSLPVLLLFSVHGLCQESNLSLHEVKVLEVQQVNAYTYLLVKGNAGEKWLAVPSLTAKIGETYYYEGGMEMLNFKSSELNKTFESVLFLESISKKPINNEKTTFQHGSSTTESPKAVKPTDEKLAIAIAPVVGGISIAELYKNKKAYEGKTVKIKGLVTKFNAQVMSKNWVHLQDGTEYHGEFDLTITTNVEVKIGDVITVEGKVFLDRDFGYGYFYKLIVENAVLIK